jgi:secreted protein with Ig-like and vWFA domain
MNTDQTLNPNTDHPHDDSPFSPEQLTAWALGEGETLDPEIQTAIATAYDADATVRGDVDAVRATAALFTEDLGAEPAGTLSAEQRAAILAVTGAVAGAEQVAGDVENPVEAPAPPRDSRDNHDNVIRPRWADRLRRPERIHWPAVAAVLAVVFIGVPLMRWTVATGLHYYISDVYWWLDEASSSGGHDAARREGSREDVKLGPRPSLADYLLWQSPSENEGRARDGMQLYEGAAASVAPADSAPPSGQIAGGPQQDAETAAMVAPEMVLEADLRRLPPATQAIAGAPMVGAPIPGASTAPFPPADYPEPLPNTESYAPAVHNPFVRVADAPLSTFSIDVDTASYANVRRFIQQMGTLPPADAVRIEEMINYFDYGYTPPAADSEDPFAVNMGVAVAPWQPEHRLVRIGLKGREIERAARPDSNLVFLIDVSGSMADENKLSLVKQSLALLVEELGARDRVAIVVYAGESGLVLPSTPGSDRRSILDAIEGLGAGGSTNGAGGIQQAYDIAAEQMIEGGVNRVILATDGDFNVGITSEDDLQRLIEDEAKRGIFLTTLGYGMGNYKDTTLELLADKGNGNYAYIDTLAEARKVLVEQMSGTLVAIAKDVKIQVEFNPAKVAAYRLIGYENRMLAARDFDDDTKDAGEIGAGHSVTALYEIVPVGVPIGAGVAGSGDSDPLRYQPIPTSEPSAPQSDAAPGLQDRVSSAHADELMLLKLRFKPPNGLLSRKIEFPITDDNRALDQADPDFRFAAAVAAFGMILRESPYRGNATLDMVARLAEPVVGQDPSGLRREFLDLVAAAQRMSGLR